MTRIIEHVQWLHAVLATANGGTQVVTGPGMGAWSESLPFVVPSNRWLLIWSMGFGSKFGNSGRASYFWASGVTTIPDNAPHLDLKRSPLILPPGQTLTASFINNETMTPEQSVQAIVNPGMALSGESQWVNTYITGWLVDDQPGMTRRTCLEGLPL